jgi:hypothetical protein
MHQWDIFMEKSTISLPETANKEKKKDFSIFTIVSTLPNTL